MGGEKRLVNKLVVVQSHFNNFVLNNRKRLSAAKNCSFSSILFFVSILQIALSNKAW